MQTKLRMSDDCMTVGLHAAVFSDKEEKLPEFIVKFQAFLVTKGWIELIQTNFKSELPVT